MNCALLDGAMKYKAGITKTFYTKKWSSLLRVSSVNLTKSAEERRFYRVY